MYYTNIGKNTKIYLRSYLKELLTKRTSNITWQIMREITRKKNLS